MQLSILVLALLVGSCFAEEERHRTEEKHDDKKLEHQEVGKGDFKIDEKTKDKILTEKKENVFVLKALEYFLKNPNTARERECFAKVKPGESIDFVIDIAASPSSDEIDKMSAESPMGLYLEYEHRSASRSYFRAIASFIDGVTFDMKPELTHTILVDNKRKYVLHGREVKQSMSEKESAGGLEFTDKVRNLKTLWPTPTKSLPESKFKSVLKNNLGRLTYLALWNRDNGLPTVLSASKRSKPIYTIVITDGLSGSKLSELTENVERTTVIDIGNQRFFNRLGFEEVNKLFSVINLTVPQALGSMISSVRSIFCRVCCEK